MIRHKNENGSVNVSTNTATIYIHTKGAADARVCIDDISFASVDGEKCTEAIPYPNKYIGESSVGEILVNTKSASFATSDGWKKSSVIGDEYASWYKLNATASDYAMWTETASVSGEYDVCVYNVESGGKVQRQKVTIYKDGACIFTHDTADRAGWETYSSLTLTPSFFA